MLGKKTARHVLLAVTYSMSGVAVCFKIDAVLRGLRKGQRVSVTFGSGFWQFFPRQTVK